MDSDKIEVDGKLIYDKDKEELVFILDEPIYSEALDNYLIMLGFLDLEMARCMFCEMIIDMALDGEVVYTSMDLPLDMDVEDDVSLVVYV